MLCEKCKQKEAVVDFADGNAPINARKRWHLCECCLEQMHPGMGQTLKKAKVSGMICGWTSYPLKKD